jgi:hypothetical protein
MRSNSSRSWLPAARPPEADAVPVAQVAHGLNNTLTVITGSSEVIFSSGYARDVALGSLRTAAAMVSCRNRTMPRHWCIPSARCWAKGLNRACDP